MTPLAKKLNLGVHRNVLVLDAPSAFEAELSEWRDVVIHRAMERTGEVGWLLAFVTDRAAIAAVAALLPKIVGDPVLWFAYPKRSSKRYRCDFDRDTGWDALGALGFEGVRQVAIDQDWSALRFRRVEYIKSFRRDPSLTISAAGRSRAGGK